jgi:hypothetical protein
MNTSNWRRLTLTILSASMVGAAVPACDDEDNDTDSASEEGNAGRGTLSRDAGADEEPAKAGSGGRAGTGGRSPTGGRGGATAGHNAGHSTDSDAGPSAGDIDSPAADLRVSLNLLLSEHVVLAAKATGAALGGRSDEFSAYGELLNMNGTDVGKMIKAAFGEDAETKFNGIWSAHNGFFVDYTTGVAEDDSAKMDKAVKDLTETYVPQFAALISSATGLPEASVAELTTAHVLTTKAIVDAQGREDWPATYTALREAFAHMVMLGDPLSKAIAAKKPDDFAGSTDSKAVDLRVALNELLQEHLYLATFATGAALGGRNDEFAAAGSALNDNGTDVGAAIRGLYGAAAETEFNRIWSAHNGFFVDYTTGVATDDTAKQDKAVKDLTETYVPDFAAFLNMATDVPTATLATLTTDHVLTTKAVVDAQAGSDLSATANADRLAGQHMQGLGDPLSAAIVAKLPEKF